MAQEFEYAYLQPSRARERPGYLQLIEIGTIEAESEEQAAEKLFVKHNVDDRPRSSTVRSMSVGDILAFTTGKTLQCVIVGWWVL
jgi:hypothetical protein